MVSHDGKQTFILVLLFFFFSVNMSQDSPVGFIVFGFGRAGSIHANNLIRNSQAMLKYTVDIDEEKAKEFVKSNYLDTKAVPPSAMENALGDPTITAAVITTPTHLHHENQVLSCFIPSPQSEVRCPFL